jgi:DNA-binding beta-propeller fold protein YncE
MTRLIPTIALWLLALLPLACRQAAANPGPAETVRQLWKVPTPPQAIWVDFDASDNIYVLDYDEQKVTKLAPDGRRIGELGKRGQEAGSLSKSRRFAQVDGRLYFANEGNGRIEVLGTSGEVFPPIELPGVTRPGEVYFANQNFYVTRRFASNGGSFVYAYDRRWTPRGELRRASPSSEAIDRLSSLNTVCTAPDGLWLVYLVQNRIEKVAWDGKVLLETNRELDDRWPFRKDAKGRVIPEILVHRACAVDAEGNLYVVYSNPENWKRGNDVYKFNPDGRLLQKAFTLPIFNATMMRFDRQGNFFFSDGKTLTKARIERTSRQ